MFIHFMSVITYNREDVVDHRGIAAVIKNEQGEILMQEHVKYGFWTIPVGKVKYGQNILEGLKEEIFDECNLVIKRFKEITSRNFIYQRNGKRVIVSSHLFEVVEYSGVMKNNEFEKHSTQLFMDLERIKKLPYLSDMTLLYLETLGFKRNAHLS